MGRKNHGIPGEKQLVEATNKRIYEESIAKRESLANEDRLVFLEDIIARGIQTFLEVGRALQEIRDNKLWKPSYANFASYCEAKWDWSTRYANIVIRSATVARALTPVPKNEAIARALAPLWEKDPDLAQEIWASVTNENSNPTAKEVKVAIRDPKPLAPANRIQDGCTVRALTYLKNMQSSLDRATRQKLFTAIYFYAQEQMYLSHGVYRFKDQAARKTFLNKHHPRPFEEPTAEYPEGQFI